MRHTSCPVQACERYSPAYVGLPATRFLDCTPMTPIISSAIPWIVGACALLGLVLVLVVVAPWSHVRAESPLDHEVQARLMLGEDPDEIDRDLAQRAEEHRTG
jgi:hypothetical protein